MPEKTTKQEERDENIQRYELVYLISNKYSEDELEPITSNVLKLIKDNGGEIVQEENWGKKKLAYPIKRFFYAYYYIIEFNLAQKNKENVKKLAKHLRLSEEVLRHLIVKKRIKTQGEIEQEQRVAQRMAEQQVEEAVEKIPESKVIKEAKEKKKVSMEELDEKLDKILDDTESLL